MFTTYNFKKLSFGLIIVLMLTSINSYAKKKIDDDKQSTDPKACFTNKNPFRSHYTEIFRNKLILAFYNGSKTSTSKSAISSKAFFDAHVVKPKKRGRAAAKYHSGTKILGRKYYKLKKEDDKKGILARFKKKLAEHIRKKDSQTSVALAEAQKKLDKAEARIDTIDNEALRKSREKQADRYEKELEQVEKWIKEGEDLIADIEIEEVE